MSSDCYFPSKRFQVMDLYHGNQREPKDLDWTNVKDKLPEGMAAKVLVKKENGDESLAYYFADKGNISNIQSNEFTYFWSCTERKPLPTVVSWKALKDEDK